jgi:CRP-like cAMP-binding protein
MIYLIGGDTMSLTSDLIRGHTETIIMAQLIKKDSYGYEEDGVTISVYLSREDLASLSNMTTSNAIRTLTAFVNERLITVDGRKIKIIDEEKLNRISKFG